MSSASSDYSTEPDLSGLQMGDYRVLRRLGVGATAVVYLAEQVSLSRQIALKVLRQELAKDESCVQRFRNEAMAAASLIHPNIVQIYEVSQIEGFYIIAQEYVPGRNVGELIQRQGALNLRLAVAIMRQVAAALAKAAEQGIVHRDVKPENILLSRSGEVKVADFGLARTVDGNGAGLTQVGVTMGTPLYMSPEQIEGRRLDPRSDVYSFGITCYHMLAGQPPFHGETALAVAVQHLKASPERIENRRPDLPSVLARTIHKMLAKSPEDRFQDPLEMLAEIRSVASTLGDSSTSHGEHWTEGELAALEGNPFGLTGQLDELMKTSAMLTQSRGRKPWIVVGMLLCMGLGTLLYLSTRSKPLLTSALQKEVPEYRHANEQLYHAKMADTPQAWQAVIDRFPGELAAKLAKQNLARHYLANAQYDQALQIFDELCNLGETDAEFTAFGQAGKCIVYHLTDQPAKAQQAYNRIDQEDFDLLDERIRSDLDQVDQASRRPNGG